MRSGSRSGWLRGLAVAVVCAGAFVAACGAKEPSQDGGETAADAGSGTATGTTAAAGGGDPCPLTEDELSSATAVSWTLDETLEDHPLETLDSVTATVCVFTSADLPQQGGDPLVLRVDVVDSGDADLVRQDFTETCGGAGGAERAGGGGTVCERDGTVVEGYTGDLVSVYVVNADTATAAKLTPSFEAVLSAAA